MKKLIITSIALATFATATAQPAAAQHCTVQKGDSIWRIAKEYHLDFQTLKELNEKLHEDLSLIHPGDKIETHAGSGGHTTTTPQSSEHDAQSTVTTAEQASSNSQAQQVLELVNQERAKAGAKPLSLDAKLNEVAAAKSKDMAEHNYFSHDSPTYGSPFQMMHSFGVDYRSAGENIAAGQKTPEEVMESWMNSSGHRANILNASYTKLGVGYYEGGSYGTYWTQEFTQ